MIISGTLITTPASVPTPTTMMCIAFMRAITAITSSRTVQVATEVPATVASAALLSQCRATPAAVAVAPR